MKKLFFSIGSKELLQKIRRKIKTKSRRERRAIFTLCVCLVLFTGVLYSYISHSTPTPNIPLRSGEETSEKGHSVQAYTATKKKILSSLKSPSTANFSTHLTEAKGNNEYWVAGYVDSQNSFGAMIRTTYGCVALYLPKKGEFDISCFYE